MAYITTSRLDNVTNKRKVSLSKGLGTPHILNESYNPTTQYDIFLSHSYLDKERIASLKIILQSYGFSVYVDWMEDQDLNRNRVTPETAGRIRERMKNCTSLVYAVSNNSSNSKWMPWELGYFDGINGKIAILPIVNYSSQSFTGTEYIALYPIIQEDQIAGKEEYSLWIHDSKDYLSYIIMESWLKGNKPFKRT